MQDEEVMEKPTQQKIAFILVGICISIFFLEIGLRIGSLIFLSLQEYRNLQSIRQKGAYRILCLGESTTADSYPNQLEEILNQKNIGIKFSVINKGLPGINTGIIISQLQNNLEKYDPNMVITMIGINDKKNSVASEDMLTKIDLLSFNSLRVYKLISLIKGRIMHRSKRKEENCMQTENSTSASDEAYIKSGRLWWIKKEGSKAEEMFKKAVEINPKNVDGYIELARYYKYHEKDVEAEDTLKKAMEKNPENDIPYLELGMWLWIKRDYGYAEELLKKAITVNSRNDLAYGILAYCYNERGQYDLATRYFKKANKLRARCYYLNTYYNYQVLAEIIQRRGIKLVCVQYPLRSIEPLKNLFKNAPGIIFVDNDTVFRKALEEADYDEYFRDNFAGDFGHCTVKGNKLLAENIADAILSEYFNR